MTDTLPPDALIEAALLTQSEPLGEKTLRQLCDPPLSQDKLIDVLGSLKARWQNRALQLVHSGEGWRFQIAPTAYARLGALQETRSPRYSRAVMETLAIIAYQQPVTRGDIEGIRGVAVSQNVMQTLLDRGWIETIGHRDTVGRPALWATTPAFSSIPSNSSRRSPSWANSFCPNCRRRPVRITVRKKKRKTPETAFPCPPPF